ncbi:DegT/DnrJ/EryC1/StrS aminotransferase family protein [Helicobacter sp. MIT 99-5507]|uniref:DegT/DnrJ/EryC1/StrS family aminotransferase n=1 Tax=Helicobacter sp. MIT 99-5507 TaxID=152489 RepID=UPI000E1F5069|nr:DegT/DnrJ/EryC1/StrS family aminotransferase [Helicobacter sp. MIT 99-5507]RDU57471.1 aminotransferase DegT [Helicobacter sp. MIT 99-5507]
MEFINLKAQYNEYKLEINQKINEILESSKFIMGEHVNSFEKNIANYTGSKHAIGCSSGTDALILSLMALDIKQGDEVITSPFSFIASIEAILLLGAKPVFVDIDEKTYNIDVSLLKNAITPKTKAIIPVSIFGQMANLIEINKIAGEIPVIEDAAQSFGASLTYNNKKYKSCNASFIATTSFFPSKPLGCYGDGGAIFCNDDRLNDKIRCLLNHGQTKRYKHSYIGLNARLDALQAGILDIKLKYLDNEISLRGQKAKYYNKHLKNVITPFVENGYESVYAQYSIRCKDRENLTNKLNKHNIPYAIHYPIPLHLQEIVCNLGIYKKGDFKVTEMVCDEILSIPFSPFITKEEQDKIIECING